MRKVFLFILSFILISSLGVSISCSNSVSQPTTGVRDDEIIVKNLTTNTLTLNGLEIAPSDVLSINVAYCSLKCTGCDLHEVLTAPCHIEVGGECGMHSFHQVSSDA